MPRTNSIAVSDDEKQSLQDVATDAFGTTDVAYGAVVSFLVSEYDGDLTDETPRST
jgi:hypothetical protein